ncbi:hypothetical protein B0H21DRAFT_775486 [Amylocystis lapponica]|nr:hypothetical protein B0H21DRAFT_775486 [Amylocystis lapponica]
MLSISLVALPVVVLGFTASIVSGFEPFDGQYVHPSANNSIFEWWYSQAVSTATPDEGNPPANAIVTFNQGQEFDTGETGLPEYYLTVSGSFPNGSVFSIEVPTPSGDIQTYGPKVVGTWGTSGSFATAANLSTYTVFINASEYGVSGTLMILSNAPHHYGCNSSTDPYASSALSALPPGTTLSPAEEILYHQFGWANTIPGGSAIVDLVINGDPLVFAGHGYHDGNFGTQPLNVFVDSWYWLSAQVGPYDVVMSLQLPTNATRELTTGYLARSGVILQNQCSILGTRTEDVSTLTPYGAVWDAANNVTVPQGFIVEYNLDDGQQYSFNLTGLGQNPNAIIYRRWIGTASGGAVGEAQYEGTTVFEWLNPGMNTYTPA